MSTVTESNNFIEVTLWHGCSPVNLLHIFRKPFPKNTSGGLLLYHGNLEYSRLNALLFRETLLKLMCYVFFRGFVRAFLCNFEIVLN